MLARPRQVTIAAWVVIVGSILIVVGVAQQFQLLGSVATADTIQEALDRLNLGSVSVDQVESLARVLGMISAACATASVILAWQVMAQRSTQARLALSILAVPLFVTGVSTGGVYSTAVVVATSFLWTSEARSWFAGTWKPEPPRPATPPAEAPSTRRIGQVPPPPAPPAPPAPLAGPPASGPIAGPSTPPPPMAAWPPPYVGQVDVTTAPAPTLAPERSPLPRPRAVLAAALLTWVFSLLAAGIFVIAAAALIADPGTIMDRMRETNPELMETQGVTEEMVRGVFIFMTGTVLLWSLSACVLAFLVMRRAAWARIALIVCAGSAALVLVVASLAGPFMVIPLFAATMTVGLLVRRDVAAWLR